jgi:hypothetical protein
MQVAGVCMASDAAHYDWMQSDEWRLPPLTRTSADAAARAAAQAAKRSTQNMPAAAEGRVGSVNAALRKILQRLASPDYDGKEGTRAIIQALCTSQPAGLAEAAARLHAAVPGSSDYKGLHSHMWYLYAMAQHLLQETVLAPEVQPVLLGTGALPDVTIRYRTRQHVHLACLHQNAACIHIRIAYTARLPCDGRMNLLQHARAGGRPSRHIVHQYPHSARNAPCCVPVVMQSLRAG